MSLPTSNLSVHPLIALLDPRPDDQRRFVAIFGFIGPSTRDGFITLYPSLDLRSHLEICVDDIVFAEPAIPGLESSPTKLIVSATAAVTRVENTRNRVAVSLLSGKITEANLGDGGTKVLETEVSSRIIVHELSTSVGGTHPTTHCVSSGACTSDPLHL